MAIEIRAEGGELCPRIVCDVCAEPIDDGKGNVLWERGRESELRFTHKRCYRAFKTTYETPPDGTHHLWQPLSVFLHYLTTNTGHAA